MSPDPFALYRQALTHSSYGNEKGTPHNERLEFLGDAVLKTLVAELLYDRLPGANEGHLSRTLHQLVGVDTLSSIGRELGLGPLIRLGAGERRTAQAQGFRPALLEDAVEALLGAIFLDQGLDCARAVVRHWMEPRLGEAQLRTNPKTALSEWCQAHFRDTPRYEDGGGEGPDHSRLWSAAVVLPDGQRFTGRGAKKQDAQVEAATAALAVLCPAG